MINLYSGSSISEPIKRVSSGVYKKGMENAGTFNNTAFQRNLAKKGQINKDMLDEAISVFGEDTVRNWKAQSGELMTSIRNDLQEMRQTATEARAQGDMDAFRRAMERALFDKQLLTYGNMLDKASQNDLIAAFIGGAGGLIGSVAGSEKGQDLLGRLFGKKEYNTSLPKGNLVDYLGSSWFSQEHNY